MNESKVDALQLLKKYEAIIKQFVVEEKGCFVVYTDDSIVAKSLRDMFFTHLQLKGDSLRFVFHDEELFKKAKRIHEARGRALFFIERTMNAQSNAQAIKFLKITYPNCLIMLMIRETERNELIYLQERGVDNFVVKPVLMDTLVEKVALTVRPQGKLAQLVGQGKDFVQQGEYFKAMEIADKILEIKPNSPAALMIMGDALNRTGRKDEALQAYMTAAENAKMYLEPLKKIAEFFKEKQDHESQLKYLEKLEQLSPLNMERKREIGEIHLKQGRTEQAEAYFQEAIKVTMKQAKDMVDAIKVDVAESCLQSDDAIMAEKYFREIVETKTVLTSADVHVFNLLGIALRKQGKWEQAIKEFKKVLNVAKDMDIIHYNIHYNIGMAYMEGKRFQEADAAFERALFMNRGEMFSNDRAIYNMGLAKLYLKKVDEARELFLRVKELNPNFPGIDKQLGVVS